MKAHEPQISVQVDVANPGQFFACCGLLELAHRLWPGAEGRLDFESQSFQIFTNDGNASLHRLLDGLRSCALTGLSDAERTEREALEADLRRLRAERRTLPEERERRRAELGTKAREGDVLFGPPFSLTLNWWQSDDEETPKTWAGRQEIHKVARAAQDALRSITDATRVFDHSCVMRLPEEYRVRPGDESRTVEPFYFDARRFVHALDTGFSLDVQGAETIAHPAVELLALVGLQRFRPVASETRGVLDYFVWSVPLAAMVAAAVASGAVPHPDARRYHSRLRYRDNQRRYKAFSPANQTEPTPNE